MKKAIAGKEYLCIKTVVMENGKILFIQGKKYKSENDGCITNEENNPCHCWTKKGMKEFFRLSCGIETEPEYVITKRQLKQLYEQGNHYTKSDIDYLFPDALNEHKIELPKHFTGWAKTIDKKFPSWFGYFKNGFFQYGNSVDNNWVEAIEGQGAKIESNDIDMTREEVTEYLTKEVANRYKSGDFLKCIVNGYLGNIDTVNLDNPKDCCVSGNGTEFWIPINVGNQNACVLKNGKWAEIIETISKEDAEKELGKKIV